MRKIMILNPAAGHGDAAKLSSPNEEVFVYTTVCVGDAERYVEEECKKNPETHFIVCGGDGTVNEVVNGIMKADVGDSAVFSIIPTGSGNDFVKNNFEKKKTHKIDVIKINDRYAINMINIGFDCDVVEKTQYYKQKHKGSTAYILGVVDVLFKPFGKNFKIRYTTTEDEEVCLEQECLLCAIANGAYCGGGFNFAPLSSATDGVLDVLIVKKISRAKFISVVAQFRAGKFIEKDGTLKKAYKGMLDYVKCTSIDIESIDSVCIDGEVNEASYAHISILPQAINYHA